jgi:hypothetical protein
MTITFAQLLALTMLPCLCIGFMIFDTITWFRIEKKLDALREDKRLMREELDSMRTQVKEAKNAIGKVL